MVTGCGNQGAEPQDKDWSEGEDQQDKGNGQEQMANEKPDKPEEPEEYTFVKKYVDAMNNAMKSGDGEQLRALGTEDCNACTTMADFQEDLHGKGGEYLGDPSYKDLELIDGPKQGDDKLTWVRVSMTQPKVEQRPEKGAQPTEVGGVEEFNDFGLIQEEGTWKVAMFCGVTEGQPKLGCLGQ